MKPIVSYEECVRDSPKFRDALEENHSNLEDLESRLEKVLKNCNSTIESGRLYLDQQNNLVQSILQVSKHFDEDPPVVQALNKIGTALTETLKYHYCLLDQASRTVSKSISNFIKKDLKQVRDSRQVFEKVSAEMDDQLAKNAQPSRKFTGKDKSSSSAASANAFSSHGNVGGDESSSDLISYRTRFRITALDHLNTVTLVQAKKRHELLDTLRSYMEAQSVFFHQGSKMFIDVDAFLVVLCIEVSQLRQETNCLQKEMENRHKVVTNRDYVPLLKSETSDGTRMQGYLFKKNTSAFKTWNRRWFAIRSSQLVYRKRGDQEETVMEQDLKLCSVKPLMDIDRRYCFEVISPTKSHVLQADTEEMFHVWINAFKEEIGALMQMMLSSRSSSGLSLNDSPRASHENAIDNSSGSKENERLTQQRILSDILKVPGNEKCCDCSTENPEWASINLGITLCIACSGVHRSLGVHISKVRSLTWDKWEAEVSQVMTSLGNTTINQIYECQMERAAGHLTPLRPDSLQLVRDAWIQSKYEKKLFIDQRWNAPDQLPENALCLPESGGVDPNWLLAKGAETGNIIWICRALALGADRNTVAGNDLKRAPIHLAVLSGSVTSLQYLLLNGAKINITDVNGKTPLLIATESGLPTQVGLLLKNRADQDLADKFGNTPLKIAVETANADIVSFLRISRLNDEMRETEFGETPDDTLQEMVRDFLR